MPLIDGYDDLDTGGSFGFPEGEHTVEITGAKLVSGDKKDGTGKWHAIDIQLEGNGRTANTKLYYPASTAEWQGWSEGRRKLTKRQLDRIGLHMSTIENETARASIIGNPVTVKAEKNGEYMNYYFQDAGSKDGSSLPEPEQVASEGTAPATSVTPATAVVV